MAVGNKTQIKRILKRIESGSCTENCKKIWLAAIKRALRYKSNPLNLTEKERKQFEKIIESVKGKKATVKKATVKKYVSRPSPPYPANDYCGKRKKGNDGKMYLSKPNKNGICRWVKSTKSYR